MQHLPILQKCKLVLFLVTLLFCVLQSNAGAVPTTPSGSKDPNAYQPTFSSTHYDVTIEEDYLNGTLIPVVMYVTDADPGKTYNISIADDSMAKLFEPEPASGRGTTGISLRLLYPGALDQDVSGAVQQLTVPIIAHGEGGDQDVGKTELTIFILATNDEIVLFQHELYQEQLPEDYPLSGSFLTIRTIEGDKPTENLDFRLMNGEDLVLIVPGPTRTYAYLYLRRALDFEKKREHSFVVEATDGVFTSYTTVDLRVTNVNDNPPIPESPIYNTTVYSGTTDLYPTVIIHAYDMDQPWYQENYTYPSYTVLPSSQISPQQLKISQYGELSLHSPLVLPSGKPEQALLVSVEVSDGLHKERVSVFFTVKNNSCPPANIPGSGLESQAPQTDQCKDMVTKELLLGILIPVVIVLSAVIITLAVLFHRERRHNRSHVTKPDLPVAFVSSSSGARPREDSHPYVNADSWRRGASARGDVYDYIDCPEPVPPPPPDRIESSGENHTSRNKEQEPHNYLRLPNKGSEKNESSQEPVKPKVSLVSTDSSLPEGYIRVLPEGSEYSDHRPASPSNSYLEMRPRSGTYTKKRQRSDTYTTGKPRILNNNAQNVSPEIAEPHSDSEDSGPPLTPDSLEPASPSLVRMKIPPPGELLRSISNLSLANPEVTENETTI